MRSHFGLVVTLVLLVFTFMLWKGSSHPLVGSWVRIAMRLLIVLIALLLLWNLIAAGR